MTPLRQRMIEQLQLRNSSEATINTYVKCVWRFAKYFHQSPDQLSLDKVREYLLHLRNEKKDAWTTIQVNRAALKFLYVRVLRQTWFDDEIPAPKKRPIGITVLSAEQITRILDNTHNLKHWTILATFYATALRCDELRNLKVSDIDAQRMVLHVRAGKGSVPRDIPLSSVLRERLRIYYRWRKPIDWLFPSKMRPNRPVDNHTLRTACANAGRRAGIPFPVHPHLFRHYAASRTMPHVDVPRANRRHFSNGVAA